MLFSGTLQGGLGVYIYPTDRFKTISIHAVWVQDLTRDAAAPSALIPPVLRRGTSAWPTWTAMEERLEDLYGAGFRADVGKLGDKQLVSFHIDVPDGRFLPEHPDTLAQGMEFLSAVMLDPHINDGHFPRDTVRQEKETLRRQMQSIINNKAQWAMLRLLETMADGRAFGLRRFGQVEDLDAIDATDLYRRYRTLVSDRTLLVFVVGAVEEKRADALVRQYWTGGGTDEVTPVARFQPRHKRKLVVDAQDVRQAKLNLGYGTGVRLPDASFPALMMYAGVLGGFPHSKLFMNVRERASLAYYADARLDGALGMMVIGSGIEFKDFEAALEIIEQQVEEMAQGHISEQEMAFTLRALTNELRSEEDAPGALIGHQLERIILGGGITGEALIPALERVTVADVAARAEELTLDTVYFLTAHGEEPHVDIH